MTIDYTQSQIRIVQSSLDKKVFLEGPAGTGKTTAGVGRMLRLISEGVPAGSILLLVPQRTLAGPYEEALNSTQAPAGEVANLVTVDGLAQRMVQLFWPLAGEQAGFAHPDQPPTFLTLETAQYYMAHLVRPLLEEGYFESVALARNRLYSQILDNLNKAAVVGFPYQEIGQRLKAAWVGEISQGRVYDNAQDCANRFRQYCLEHNLLDFSLQIEVFFRYLWPDPLCRDYLRSNYRHLIVDNVEEDTPVAHRLLKNWLPEFDSALLIYDCDAGYRRFLGTDPQSGFALREGCDTQVTFDRSFVTSDDLQNFGERLGMTLRQESVNARTIRRHPAIENVLSFEYHRYFPQMLDWVASETARLVKEEHITPGEIVILAPYLPDALRFSLSHRLESLGIPVRSHRPSRPLREEPTTQCLLTLAALAHPAWRVCPTRFDVAYAFIQGIEDMDLVRAQLLAEIVYRPKNGEPKLGGFEEIKPEVQDRITFTLGQRYEFLRTWLENYAGEPEQEFDIFLSRLFGEVLSQRGFGFHKSYTAGEIAANLIESARKFRWATGRDLGISGKPSGKEYLEMVQDGVVAAQYIRSWQNQPENAVLLAPAYTFLLNNRPVDYQFWLDIGSRGWSERLNQPLTQPYVLSQEWPEGKTWTDADEFQASQEALSHLVLGLVRRCRKKIFLGLNELNEQGNEQKGPLLRVIQQVLRGLSDEV